MRTQRRRTRSRLDRQYALLLLIWAGAWLIGFLTLWSAADTGGNPWWRVPDAVAWTLFTVVNVAGIVASGVVGTLASQRGIRGRSWLSGLFYGLSWPISIAAAAMFGGAIVRTGASFDTLAVLFPGLFLIMIGMMYLFGAALDRSTIQFVLGVIVIVLAVVGGYAGSPTNYLIYGTLGPAALFIVAILTLRGILPADDPRPTARPRTGDA